MDVRNTMQLSLDSDTFAGMKEDFDTILEKTIENMESKSAYEATITLKLGISLMKTSKPVVDADEAIKEVTLPTFKHDISTVMQVKAKKSGMLDEECELVWDEDEQKYVLVRIKDNQLSLFEADEEEAKGSDGESVKSDEDEAAYDTNTPFGWLRQFVGEKLTVTEAMGNYTVRTKENKIILSSASDEDSPFHCDAETLKPHVGHEVVCVGYGGELLVNVAIECEDCCETLFSIDFDYGEDDEEADGYEFDEPELS